MFSHIKLTNFRNHADFELELEKTTVLVGPNGIGKSNILEAVGMLSFCRSFREEDRRNLIQEGAEYSRIKGDDLELFIAKLPRLSIKARDSGVPRRSSDFVGILPSVIFSPETLSIITGSPSERRHFLDAMVGQEDKEYYESLLAFGKVRKQRNNLLERISERKASKEELDFWNREFILQGQILENKREEAINFINQFIAGFYREISDSESDLKVDYIKSSKGDLAKRIEEGEWKEIASGTSLYGPHRDDLVFMLKGKDASSFASRGEVRSIILALKICELKFIEDSISKSRVDKAKYKPILLLDDVFSEFDPERRAHLGHLISEYQSLITTTEKEHLSEDLLGKVKVVELS